MESNAEIKTKYENLVKSASTLYLEKQFQKALATYNDALKLSTEANMSKMIVCILKYMICCCLYESNKLEDLAEVVNILQTIDGTVKNCFPAAYCLLAQTHCKLFRFELAEKEFKNADAIFSKNPTLETYCIPGTSNPIKPTSKDDETWSRIKEECLAYHQPDAICSFFDCNYVAKPYVIPNKNIFLKDPAFSGMVVVNCNNKDQPCVLKFHQSCWKMKKDELYPISKVLDKDILGDKCFTLNCLNGNDACVISSIQVFDHKGELKANIKENTSITWSIKPQDKSDNNCKGAVKKFKVNPVPKRPENPVSSITSVQRQLLVSLRNSRTDTSPAKDIHCEDNIHYYDESQTIIVKDKVVDVDFSHDPPEINGEKSFLHSFFLDYIQKNHVAICDVYSKFNEYNQDLNLKDLDILGFLLETNNFEILSNRDVKPTDAIHTAAVHTKEVTSQPNESLKEKSFDDDSVSYIDDVYYELTNEKDEMYVDCTENAVSMKSNIFNDSNFDVTMPDNYQSQYHLDNNNFVFETTGGDASEHLQSLESGTKFNCLQSPLSPSTDNDVCDNRKLKDYITKLESDMEKIINENSNLRKDIMNKDFDIESFKKEQENFQREQESYQEKIKMCEQLFETMTDFQKGYDNIKEENIKIKKELAKIIKEKNDLEGKVEELEDPENRRIQFMKIFQEEHKLLQQALTEEWESKVYILKKSLKTEIEVKMSLLNKLLNSQYSSNKHTLTGYLNQCSDFLEVTNKVNAWMEKAMNVKNFLDNSEWLKRLELLQMAANELQFEYSKTLNELHVEKQEKYRMTDINLKVAAIPNAPSGKLCDVVISALNAYHRHQYQIMQNYVMKAQQATQAATQAMQYQMQSASQPQAYNSVHAGYMQQYPAAYCSTYSNVQTSVPTTPLVGVTPMPTYNHMIPETDIPATPPPNLTLQQIIPASQSLAKSQDPVKNVKIEKSKPANVEPSAPPEVDDILLATKNGELKEDVNKGVKAAKAADKNDTFKDKIAQMREAFKTIALNVKEKSNSEKVAEVDQKEIEKAPEKAVRVEQITDKKDPEKITAPAKKLIGNQVKDTAENVITQTNGQNLGFKDAVSIRDDRSDITTLTTRNDSKSQKKVGMDGLVKLLMKKFPGAMECDVIEAIAKIRKERNDALTGIPVSRIIEEAKTHIQQSQRSHVIRY